MKKTILFLLVMLLPIYCEAYTIYLNNGSVISGVNSYEEKGEKVNIYFSTGSMIIQKNDILKIEGQESTEQTAPVKEESAVQQKQEQSDAAPLQPQTQQPQDDKNARINTLRDELVSVNSQIVAAQEEENRIIAEINQKQGARTAYNIIQLKQLEKELEPLKQDLNAVQQKKEGLIQKKNDIESEINSLQ